VLSSDVAPSITGIAPAYNESATITESVRTLLILYYTSLQLVVVNDGSSEETMDVLGKQFSLSTYHPMYEEAIETRRVMGTFRSQEHPELILVDKENCGKVDALNDGLNITSGDLVCAIDADAIIEPDALK